MKYKTSWALLFARDLKNIHLSVKNFSSFNLLCKEKILKFIYLQRKKLLFMSILVQFRCSQIFIFLSWNRLDIKSTFLSHFILYAKIFSCFTKIYEIQERISLNRIKISFAIIYYFKHLANSNISTSQKSFYLKHFFYCSEG